MLRTQFLTNSFKQQRHMRMPLLRNTHLSGDNHPQKTFSLDLKQQSRIVIKQVAQNFLKINNSRSKFLPSKHLQHYSKSLPSKYQNIQKQKVKFLFGYANDQKSNNKSSSLEIRLYTTLNLFKNECISKKDLLKIKKYSLNIKGLNDNQRNEPIDKLSQQTLIVKQPYTIKKNQKNKRFKFKEIQETKIKQKNTQNIQSLKNHHYFNFKTLNYSITPWQTLDY